MSKLHADEPDGDGGPPPEPAAVSRGAIVRLQVPAIVVALADSLTFAFHRALIVELGDPHPGVRGLPPRLLALGGADRWAPTIAAVAVVWLWLAAAETDNFRAGSADDERWAIGALGVGVVAALPFTLASGCLVMAAVAAIGLVVAVVVAVVAVAVVASFRPFSRS